MKQLNDDEWQAIMTCDQSFDGVFYYGVKTTGIFCLPSCKSPNPLRQNVVLFENAADAINLGFRACLKCGIKKNDE